MLSNMSMPSTVCIAIPVETAAKIIAVGAAGAKRGRRDPRRPVVTVFADPSRVRRGLRRTLLSLTVTQDDHDKTNAVHEIVDRFRLW